MLLVCVFVFVGFRIISTVRGHEAKRQAMKHLRVTKGAIWGCESAVRAERHVQADLPRIPFGALLLQQPWASTNISLIPTEAQCTVMEI